LSIISLKTGRLADLILALDRQAAGQVASPRAMSLRPLRSSSSGTTKWRVSR
jgi:hypothetical protein